MIVENTALDGVKIITTPRFGDARGYFVETWNSNCFQELSVMEEFVQDNQSFSAATGTVRGLHCQIQPHAQAKLVRVVAGAIFDVAVDIRRTSTTFGSWIGIDLHESDDRQILIPQGFLHGFITRMPNTIVCYKCSSHYAPEYERSVRFDDPALGIEWGVDVSTAVLSPRDAAAPSWDAFEPP